MDPAQTALARGKALVDARRFEDAVVECSAAVALKPEWARAHCYLAQAYLGSGRPTEALRSADTAASLEPGNAWPHRLRSLSLADLGSWRRAYGAAQDAVRIEPSSPAALHTLGRTQIKLGRLSEAEETVNLLLSLAPELPGSHHLAGWVCLKKKRWREAEAHYRRGLELDPTDVGLQNDLAIALRASGRGGQAIETLQGAARTDASAPYVTRNLNAFLRLHLHPQLLAWLLLAIVFVWVVIVQALSARPVFSPTVLISLLATAAILLSVAWVVGRRRRRALDPELVQFRQLYERPSVSMRERWARFRGRAVEKSLILEFAAAYVGFAVLAGVLQPARPDTSDGVASLISHGGFLAYVVVRLAMRHRPKRGKDGVTSDRRD
jgi:Flp pilus assembly protein TadD